RRCLEKNPEDRFQSIRDLGFALDALFHPSASAKILPAERDAAKVSDLIFHRITYQNGSIWSARFAPDGKTIVYGASWHGEPSRLFLSRTEGTESLPLSLPDADILSISNHGEMAISLGRHYDVGYTSSGTLAHLPITGGAPREILENVQEADWTADGRDFV